MQNAVQQISRIGKFKSLHWIHWLVVGLSLSLTLVAWFISQHQIDEKTQTRFNNQSARVISLITERMQKYEDALWSGVAAINMQNNGVDYLEWKHFANTLHIDTKYPGINGIGVIYHVPPEEFETFLAEQRMLRPNFKVHPAHNNNEYWPITYVEPVKTNDAAVGLDMAFETNRHTAAKKTRDTGTAQITAPIVLVQDTQKAPGFLFYAPFYQGKSIPKTLEERQEKFIGMVYAPFTTYRLMEGTLKQNKRLVNIRLHDGDMVVYDEFGKNTESSDPEPMFTRRVNLQMYGRPWVLDIHAAQSFRTLTDSDQPLIILIGGLLVNAMLMWVFLLLTQSNKRAITLANNMTKQIKEEVARIIAITDRVLDGLITINGHGIIQTFNPAATQIFGYTPQEAIGKNVNILMPESYHSEDGGYWNCCQTTSEERMLGTGHEVSGKRKDGSVFPMELSVNEMLTEGEQMFVGTVRDISERKKNEEKLKLLSEKLGLILDNVGEGIYALDLNGHTTSANNAAVEMLGYSLEEMVDCSQHDLIHHHRADGTEYPQEECNIYAAFRDGKVHTTDQEVFWKKDGTPIPIEYTSTPIRDADKNITGAVVVFRDITERKQHEDARNSLTKQLLESNTELERFAYIASHDMQEPIRMVTNFSEIVAKDYAEALDETGKEYLNLIVNAGTRMRDLVENLLAYSRVGNDGIQMVMFDGESVLTGVCENLQGLFDEQHAEITHGPLPKLYGNPVQIMRLLQNLIVNAIKYQPEGNVSKIHISAEEKPEHWCISVKDNGLGIKPEFISQIFQPFRRLHTWDAIQGTGLGLSICKKIVENHNGKIWVTSELGNGSVFSFILAKKSTKKTETTNGH